MPATDEVWRLQNRDEPECKFFQKMTAQGGHYDSNNSTQQGIYICAPSGKFLASVNTTDPNRIMQLMRQGLKEWEKLDAEERKLKDQALVRADDRMEYREPQDGLILAMFARDLPENCDPDEPCGVRWNRDTAWFSKEEARTLLPDDPRPGTTYELPEIFVYRLAALHLVDTVRGQTSHFKEDEIRGSKITGKVTDVSGSKVSIEIAGKTKSDSSVVNNRQSPRGVDTNLLGKAVYDMDDEKFTEFEIVALGRRWGHTPFNDRMREENNSNPLGFVFRLADEDEPPNVPAFPWAYKAPWLYR